MVKKLKIIRAILRSDFSGWVTNIKIYLVAILMIIFLLHNFDSMFEYAQIKGYRVSPYLLPFAFTHPFMRLVIFSCIIFLFSDVPFISELQISIISRTGRKIWYGTQIIYLFICSICTTILLALFPVIRYCYLIVLQKGWGKIIISLANHTEIVTCVNWEIISRHNPTETMLYTTVVFLLVIFLLGMIIYLGNTVFRNQSIGIFIASIVIIADWLRYIFDSYTMLIWFSPLSWIDISNMAYGRNTAVPSPTYAIITLLILNTMLIIGVLIASKKEDIAVTVMEG